MGTGTARGPRRDPLGICRGQMTRVVACRQTNRRTDRTVHRKASWVVYPIRVYDGVRSWKVYMIVHGYPFATNL